MGIEKGKHFSNRAVFVDYPFENEDPRAIADDNRLFNDALRFGDEITPAQYAAGKPK